MWGLPDKAFRVRGVGYSKRLLAEVADLFGALAVDHLRGKQAQTGMMMLRVVPREELLAKTAGMLQGAEALRKVRPIFQRLELALGERIVVGYVRAAVGLGYPQIGEHKGHRLRPH